MFAPDILAATLRPTGPSDPQRPGQAITADLAFTDGDIQMCIWECTPGSFPLRRDGWSEVVTVLSGRATNHGDDGDVMELAPGSMYDTPEGYTGRWDVHESVRKAYGIVRH